MEEKRRDAAPPPPSATADSPASEPTSTRRRAGAQKRKASSLSGNSSSSTPSKRVTRDKPSPLHHHTPPLHHNGPLTRARQIPASAAAASSSAPGSAAASASAPPAVKHSERGLGADAVALAEEIRKASERESLEASMEAAFEAIRSRGTDSHVVPSHCGWFSWTDIHPIEKFMMPSFFNGKTESRTPDIYMEIRNWVMKKFHANPNTQIEVKDLSEINVGDLDSRQEIMEFLDYWGLINYHPFPSMGSADASTSDDGEAERNSLLEKLYYFGMHQLRPPVVQKASLMTQATTSGLFPESAIAEELVKQEGPAVEMLEYHCNSCSADCSRKRYHCQKQADFDLCSDCFSNRKFGSGMSSSDFILMEPAEVAGVSGGKWTDQETLLLLEALELYKENWNEIAEHVGTKSKAQCILHFVQMPIEDAFMDCKDDVETSCKETADPAATNNDASANKDASECNENNTGDNTEGHGEASKSEEVKAKVDQEIPNQEDGVGEKTCEGTSKSEDADKVKICPEGGNDCALIALKEAFVAVGYSPEPEGPSSFAEVGNPVMALAAFLARLVGPDVAVASAHTALKSILGNSPGTELAARNSFILGDQPDNKEPTTRDSKNEEGQDGINAKQDKPISEDKDLPNDHNNMEIEDNVPEDKKQLASENGDLEKSNTSKEQAIINHEGGLDNGNGSSNSKLPNDQAPSTLHDSGGSTSKAENPPSSEELQERSLNKELSHSEVETKDMPASDLCLSDKNGLRQSVKANLAGNHPEPVEKTKNTDVVSDSVPSDKDKSQTLSSSSAGDTLQKKDSVMDVELPEKSESQPPCASVSTEHNGKENDVDMMSPSHPVGSISGAENGTKAGKDQTENGAKGEDDRTEKKDDNNFEKVKCAAVTTLAAAAVKAKILANEEEDQIRELASSLIEKQLHKLQAKLAFFSDMENLVMRVREHLERSRHKLFHERAMIIASRLGIPPSSSRGAPPNLPANRIPMNFANSLPRPQMMMNPQRPPIPRPFSTAAATIPNPLASATAAGNAVRPPSQEKLSSVGTK
ncbi:hypothetical protein HN51_034317 [Arachis hypogaea]|uniref:SWI/SNF complex subunit SWI3D n=2 Tax=Arachis hypogaea TaxID=3818 RepID=A0A445A8P3_ARAHY|nr:SWI/SNF complex subunit SWI3D [Arachis ipaensis]XP_016187017.1 SWI/SNF complex subunit SWI3D [Arachis ipaensis]XP_025642304.1 SWI/SNF complex subunit SWI3D [Arachis hypogaea]XP_025642305.1 SWI/SNF complex subunit SWI3D [Arachis hypogaea]QHN99157.1 SWI/SNF complex subunit SWI3D [Arachis hypogaea]RYR22826.1 hypothetical protein Ahy_B03g068120 isoform A [Arachis hypogaea]